MSCWLWSVALLCVCAVRAQDSWHDTVTVNADVEQYASKHDVKVQTVRVFGNRIPTRPFTPPFLKSHLRPHPSMKPSTLRQFGLYDDPLIPLSVEDGHAVAVRVDLPSWLLVDSLHVSLFTNPNELDVFLAVYTDRNGAPDNLLEYGMATDIKQHGTSQAFVVSLLLPTEQRLVLHDGPYWIACMTLPRVGSVAIPALAVRIGATKVAAVVDYTRGGAFSTEYNGFTHDFGRSVSKEQYQVSMWLSAGSVTEEELLKLDPRVSKGNSQLTPVYLGLAGAVVLSLLVGASAYIVHRTVRKQREKMAERVSQVFGVELDADALMVKERDDVVFRAKLEDPNFNEYSDFFEWEEEKREDEPLGTTLLHGKVRKKKRPSRKHRHGKHRHKRHSKVSFPPSLPSSASLKPIAPPRSRAQSAPTTSNPPEVVEFVLRQQANEVPSSNASSKSSKKTE